MTRSQGYSAIAYLRDLEPLETYRKRLDRWRGEHARSEVLHRRLGNARLASGLLTVLIAALSLGAGRISPWWLLLPIVALAVLVVIHDRVDRALRRAARGVAYYERALGRLENRWIGAGSQGERFRDPRHVFADDLDLFGRGSLFELVSTARTGMGERVLAGWLLTPGEPKEVAARQESVKELRPSVDLREELALMGDDLRAALDDRRLGAWGTEPPVIFFPGARWVAFALALASVATGVSTLLEWTTLRPFLFVILAEIMFGMATRSATGRVVHGVSTPAKELRLIALLLERLEREPFSSPALADLRGRLLVDGTPSTRQIRRLVGLVDRLDWARNLFFRPIAALLVWMPQFAMAIEKWRIRYGPHVGAWVAAIGEFEAMSSLASFAYERADAMFPELVESSERDPPSQSFYDAGDLTHPLIPHAEAVPNDVALGGTTRLWIVSGSNMSGKSTLLRAVGLSVVLAWAGAPVTAGRLKLSRLRLGASMRTTDSVIDHRSRFYAEISRLKDVVDLARSGQPLLFLLDELLSGTNSHDRRLGAQAVLLGLFERDAIGLATTHDLALAEIADHLNGRALNVHFEDHLEGGEIRFDYRLRPGVVARGNALELMRAVGLDV
ncbi:MAG: mismatch repair protein MutS domain protein [Bryobacterales bacterium]|nr:mismatch repair protein MutS domain protein [Bryobacterales bacterium]